jgi:hypothetical protein
LKSFLDQLLNGFMFRAGLLEELSVNKLLYNKRLSKTLFKIDQARSPNMTTIGRDKENINVQAKLGVIYKQGYKINKYKTVYFNSRR